MKERILLALVAAVCLTACQANKPEFEVSRIKIGDTRASVLAVVPDLECTIGERAGVEECVGHGPAYEGIATKLVMLNLDEGKVEFVWTAVDPSKAGKALAATREKHGAEDKGLREDGAIEWTQWSDGGKQVLSLLMPHDGGHAFVRLKGPMYMTMHQVMPRLDLPAPDIKGVKLGDTSENVRALVPDVECMTDGAELRCLAEPVTYGGSRRARVFFKLRDNSVKQISVSHLEPADYPSLISAMVEKFGPADDEDQRKNRPHMDPDDTVWSMPYNRVILASKTGDGTAPTVSLADMGYVNAVLRETTKRTVEAL